MSGRTNMAAVMKTGLAIRSKSSERSARFGRRTAISVRLSCSDWTRAETRQTTRRSSPPCSSRGGRHDRLFLRSSVEAERPVYGRLFQTRFRTKFATRRKSPRLPSEQFPKPITRTPSSPREGRIFARSPSASRGSGVDAARGGAYRHQRDFLAEAICRRQRAVRSQSRSRRRRAEAK